MHEASAPRSAERAVAILEGSASRTSLTAGPTPGRIVPAFIKAIHHDGGELAQLVWARDKLIVMFSARASWRTFGAIRDVVGEAPYPPLEFVATLAVRDNDFRSEFSYRF